MQPDPHYLSVTTLLFFVRVLSAAPIAVPARIVGLETGEGEAGEAMSPKADVLA